MLPFPALIVAAAASTVAASAPEWSCPAGTAGIGFDVVSSGPQCLLAVPAAVTGAGPRLYVGGDFDAVAGRPIASLAAWDGRAWTGFNGIDSGVGGEQVKALTIMPIDGVPRVVAAGFFDAPQSLDGVGYFDDSATLRSFPRAPVGPHAWYGGAFAWNSATGPELVLSSGQFPQGSDYTYRFRPGGIGGAGAYALIPPGVITVTNAYAVFDVGDGAGPALYIGVPRVGGGFGQTVTRWDGSALTSISPGVSWVNALCVHDDGAGPALYAGGNGLRRLRIGGGGGWDVVPGAPTSGIAAMASFDDGTGPALFVAGQFNNAGDVPVARIARYREGVWSALGSGLSGGPTGSASAITAMTVFDDDGPGPHPAGLFVVGRFVSAGGAPAIGIARWGQPVPPCPADFNGVGGVSVDDVFDYLAAYFAGDSRADFDGRAGVTLQDLFDFLAAYFTPCA